jgi:small conductance mechanosensitive channel
MIFSSNQKKYSSFSRVYLCLLLVVFYSTANTAIANDVKSTYVASTASNLLIDTDELDIALIPLTKDELNIEAIAWFNLVKEKATIVSDAEILVNQDKRRIAAAEKISEISKHSATLLAHAKNDKVALEKLKDDIEEIKQITQIFNQQKAVNTVNEMTKTSESLTKLAEQAGDFKKNLQHEREYLIKNLTLLRSNKNNALARFQLVLEAWEIKGGDTADFKLYAKALTGTNLDLTDGDAAWLTVHGWFFSKDGGVRWLTNIIKFVVALLIVSILSMSIGKIVDSAVNRNNKVSILLKQFIAVSVRRVILTIGLLCLSPSSKLTLPLY